MILHILYNHDRFLFYFIIFKMRDEIEVHKNEKELIPISVNDIIYNENNLNSEISKVKIFQVTQYLFSTNPRFKLIVIISFSLIILTIYEFYKGITLENKEIISDGFFNSFKTISFIISFLSIVLNEIINRKKNNKIKRIELLSALIINIFLMIVSIYMLLQALHIVTDEHEINPPKIFFTNLYIIKIIIDILPLFILFKYILHIETRIKFFLWRKPNQLKECSNLIKLWNNHFENMNSLTKCLISDLISSILFVIFFIFFNKKSYHLVYMIISIINFIVVFILVKPSFHSIMRILMQAKFSGYDNYYNLIFDEISNFDKCERIIDLKYWMNAENEIKVYAKVKGSDLDKNLLKEKLENINRQFNLICDYTIDIEENE